MKEAVVLFDGVCRLCGGTVDFILARDPAARFRFAPLQSEPGRRLLKEAGLPERELTSIVLLEDGRPHLRSDAALRILRGLPFPWPLLYALVAVPRPLRDAVYDWVARNRARWFGTLSACRSPTPEERGRFL